MLQPEALDDAPQFPHDRVDFAAVRDWKERLLRLSWEQFEHLARPAQREELAAFLARAGAGGRGSRTGGASAALKAYFSGRAWTDWGPDLAFRDADALAAADDALGAEMDYERYVQFLFFAAVGARAARGARRAASAVVGDIPIYVAHDSADVWAHQELFQLDGTGRPTAVAGVPPDYFSATGQLWGNPLYRWDVLEEDGLRLVDRAHPLVPADLRPSAHRSLPRLLRLLVRAGHGDDGARRAAGCRGPGARSSTPRAPRSATLPILAEDLGDITRRRAGAARGARISRA